MPKIKITNYEDAMKYIQTLPLQSIMDIAANALVKEGTATPKITITMEEFNAHFKIRGMREDGREETRGRNVVREEE